jgi:alpha-ribazole phosphatase
MAAASTPSPEATRRPIYLLRHGAIDAPGKGRHYIGCLDLGLSEAGRGQASAWARWFVDADLEAVYCSPLSRCSDTAAIIAGGCGLIPVAVPALQEINLGDWEGQSVESIRTRHPQDYARRGEAIADFRTPGGESFRDLQRRAWAAFDELVRRHRGPLLIVTHAGVIRVLVCRMLEMPLNRLFRIGLAYGSLAIALTGPDGYRLQGLGLTAS